ncbi:glutaredoxin family protein [Candidatus Planktophila dulcis]|uniref:glutaredoxin family protein n=1 Tax=Candidatus Planktophila dulcis TaxID=1884914 RepID=UPI003BEEC8A5
MVTVYSRQGCHLCEDAVKTLEGMREELAFEIEIISIDGNPELEKLYGNEVPVIHINGEHHDFYRIDPERFRTSLEKHRRHQ